ncbi:phenylacetic acid-responsive transcriptional repressor [Pseudarthrobacter sp. MDT3-28]|uniref:PaaX family transcriptional regulator n=1 Tax=Pseudarthrobacter raffinosi TaxID=2953651 RepID=UPI00208DFD55|nr:PaaX family transcriptional regulator C-terminal domain-containing protein [Pseudarthrobacter sp. MDT3-28]MCO4239404.1 phenylacetic acid-responsive transcriptional repressor [Pseudarthrobacter sp. MDT3-28]
MQWKPRALILDLFGDYLRYAGSEVRLADITELLAVFDIEAATVRVNLSRLRKEGWFTTRRIGRETVYSLTPHMLEILNEGRERIFRRRDETWQGRWTMAIYQVPEAERAVREQLRKQLAWHGFGQLSPSTWLSPHDLISEVREIAAENPLAKVDALWCGTGDLQEDRGLAARCWDLDQLGADYRHFIHNYAALDNEGVNADKDGRTALIERMHIIGDFRRFPFRDPYLPRELQPDSWPSSDAYTLFGAVHRQLGPAATEFISSIIGQSVGQGQEVAS